MYTHLNSTHFQFQHRNFPICTQGKFKSIEKVLVITEDNLCNHKPKMLSWQKENHAGKQTLAPERHALSVYKGSATVLGSRHSLSSSTSPCLCDTPPSSNPPPEAEEGEEAQPSECPAPKAPTVEGIAQGGSAVALLAVGALVEVALGAHRVAMEATEEATLEESTESVALVEAVEEAAMEEAALGVAATAEAASAEVASGEVASEETLVVYLEEMVAAFSLEMKR